MSRNKQIDEMARAMCLQREHCTANSCTGVNCETTWLAENLYNAGYRKASDVARDIFEEIENALYSSYYCAETEDSILTFTLNKLNEAKHKHLDANFFVKMTGFSEPPIPHTIESIADLAFQESEEK